MKKRFYNLAATVLAFLILVLPGALSARERRGANLVITLKDGQQIKGELIAVKPDSLLLLAEKDESIDLLGIKSIRIVRKSKAMLGGLLAGMVATGIYFSPGGDVDQAFSGQLFVLPACVAIGIVAGAMAGTDKIIPESEVRNALGYLRGMARIRDYK